MLFWFDFSDGLTQAQWELVQASVFCIVVKQGRKSRPIGTGFFVSPTVAVSAGHIFSEHMILAKAVVSAKLVPLVVGFGPSVGKAATLTLKLRKNFLVETVKVDLAVLDIVGASRPCHLKLADQFPASILRPVTLFSFAIEFHESVSEIDLGISCFEGKVTHISKSRKYVAISADAFGGASGGAFVLNSSLEVLAMHLEHVNQAREYQGNVLVDRDDALDEMEKSLKSVIANVSSGLLALTSSEIKRRL